MADGRYDSERLIKAVEQHAQAHLLFDMEAPAKQSGAIDQCGDARRDRRLRAPADPRRGVRGARSARTARRSDANLKGFRSGLEAAHAIQCARLAKATPPSAVGVTTSSLADLERAHRRGHAAAARDIIREGARRLVAYQDVAYARLYLDRLAPVRAADEHAQSGGLCCARSRGISRCACRTRT